MLVAAMVGFSCGEGVGGPCHNESDCKSGEYCLAGGYGCGGAAIPNDCGRDSDCAGDGEAGEGLVCARVGPCGPNQCVSPCTADTDCGPNEACTGAASSGASVCGVKSCAHDSDCSGYCLNGSCASEAGKCALPPD
jgi:hypothetical protein